MIRSLQAILLSFILFSCSGKNKIPKDILSKPQMEAVLWDMISADEYIAGYVLLRDSSANKKNESIKLYNEIYQIHNTNKEQFEKSLSFYQSHPAMLIDVLDSINAKHSTVIPPPSRTILGDSLQKRIKTVQ